MKSILNTLFTGTSAAAVKKILDLYGHQHFAIVDYLYFANIAGKKLFDLHSAEYDLSLFQNMLVQEYKQKNIEQIHTVYQDAILDADLILPDGIALQIFYFLARKKWLTNLNGTDFAPYLMQELKKIYGRQRFRVVLYGTYPHLLAKTKIFLEDKWYQIVYAQDGYTNLDWSQVEKSLPYQKDTINLLLVARSTPVYPVQEIRSYANKKQIQKYNLLTVTQAGTFDFWVGEQKRPPKIIRYVRLERLRRFISDPKRNYKKVLDSLGLFRYIFSYLLLKKRSG